MNVLDLIILLLIAASVGVGLWRGFIRESVTLASWLFAAWLILRYTGPLADALTPWLAQETVRVVVAVVMLALAALTLGALATTLLRRLAGTLGLGLLDRLLGIVLGAVRGVVVVTLLVLLAGVTPVPDAPGWQNSALIPSFERLAAAALERLPADAAERFRHYAPPAGAANSVAR